MRLHIGKIFGKVWKLQYRPKRCVTAWSVPAVSSLRHGLVTKGLVSSGSKGSLAVNVMSFTQETAVDLHSLCRVLWQHAWRRSGGKHIDRSYQEHEWLSPHDVFFLSFRTSMKLNLGISLTKQNTTRNNCIISHSKNITTLQRNAFLTGIHGLLDTEGWSFSAEQTAARVNCKLHSICRLNGFLFYST